MGLPFDVLDEARTTAGPFVDGFDFLNRADGESWTKQI